MRIIALAMAMLIACVSDCLAVGFSPDDPNVGKCGRGGIHACRAFENQPDSACGLTAESPPQDRIICADQRRAAAEVELALQHAQDVCAHVANPREKPCIDANDEAGALAKKFPALIGGARASAQPSLSGGDFTSLGTVIATFKFVEQAAGDCRTAAGAAVVLTKGDDGRLYFDYSATLWTNQTASGDIWHVAWHFVDAENRDVMTTRLYDFPDGGRRMESGPGHPTYPVNLHLVLLRSLTPEQQKMFNTIYRVWAENYC